MIPDSLIIFLAAELLGLYLVRRNKRKRWSNRKWWTRPINMRRAEKSDYANLFQEPKQDPWMFFKYTRMNVQTFTTLATLVAPYLQKHSKRQPLPPELRLAVTLRYLATGDQVTSIALAYRIGISTCYGVIKETCRVLAKVLSPRYLQTPTTEQWKTIAATFLQQWNMSNCLGAIDGKHITVQAPCNSGSDYFNYKKTFSVVLMGICDANYKFLIVEIGAPGSLSDGAVYARALREALHNGDMDIPMGCAKLPGTDTKMPYFFVGDAAFQLSNHLMRPYPGHFLDEMKSVFNYRLSRARRLIENTFGILAARWRIFRRPIGLNPEAADDIILAAVCLHNFLMTKNDDQPVHHQIYCPPTFVDRETENGQIVEGDWRQERNEFLNLPNNAPHRATMAAYRQRDTLAAYFLTPQGEVPWQMEYVRRGRN